MLWLQLLEKDCLGNINVELRLPGFLGIGIGYLADAAAKITGKSLSVSSIRVKNSMGTTYFTSSVINTGSVPPVELEEGLARTPQNHQPFANLVQLAVYAASVGIETLEVLPKGGGMVHVPKVGKLVQDHIVTQIRFKKKQSPVERDGTFAGTGTPASLLVADAYTVHVFARLCGKVVNEWRKLFLGQGVKQVDKLQFNGSVGIDPQVKFAHCLK